MTCKLSFNCYLCEIGINLVRFLYLSLQFFFFQILRIIKKNNIHICILKLKIVIINFKIIPTTRHIFKLKIEK